MIEEGQVNDVEGHLERPLTEKSIRAEVTFKSLKNGMWTLFQVPPRSFRFVYQATLFS